MYSPTNCRLLSINIVSPITFTSNEKQDLEIRIINVIGEKVFIESKQQFIGEYTKQISLEEYPKAIYFLEIETNNGVINKKLILQ